MSVVQRKIVIYIDKMFGFLINKNKVILILHLFLILLTVFSSQQLPSGIHKIHLMYI